MHEAELMAEQFSFASWLYVPDRKNINKDILSFLICLVWVRGQLQLLEDPFSLEYSPFSVGFCYKTQHGYLFIVSVYYF